MHTDMHSESAHSNRLSLDNLESGKKKNIYIYICVYIYNLFFIYLRLRPGRQSLQRPVHCRKDLQDWSVRESLHIWKSRAIAFWDASGTLGSFARATSKGVR